MNAVIYARYSSDNQREESIEGQIRECTAFAEKNGITVLRHYIDRAFSAKTDNRPEFQAMVKDSGKKLFDMVIVWKLDRFARNRYDSARYKALLKKNGVKVVSATEVISEGAEGIILESVLEGYARHKAEENYLLTTKIFCGYCGAYMFGESGASHTGKVYRYYKCATVKKKRGDCHKKPVSKAFIEDFIVHETMKEIRNDKTIEAIVSMVMDLQERENTNLPLYEQQLKEAENGINNLLNAIQQGILTPSTKTRLEELEAAKEDLEIRIANEKLTRPRLTADFVTMWLEQFRKLDMRKKEHRQQLIDTFVNSVYLFDDKLTLHINYKDGAKTVTFEEMKAALDEQAAGSDMDSYGSPRRSSLRRLKPGALRQASNTSRLLLSPQGRHALWGPQV